MEIGSNRPKRTKKEIIRNLFPETARPAQRQVTPASLFNQNPPVQQRASNRCPDGGVSLMEGAQNVTEDIADDEGEAEFSLVQNPFRPAGLDERPEPQRAVSATDDEEGAFNIGKTRNAILNSRPVVDDKKPLMFGKNRTAKYTSAEIAELGLDKE